MNLPTKSKYVNLSNTITDIKSKDLFMSYVQITFHSYCRKNQEYLQKIPGAKSQVAYMVTLKKPWISVPFIREKLKEKTCSS